MALRKIFQSDTNFLCISLNGYPLYIELHPIYGPPSLVIRSGWSSARQEEPIISKFFHDFDNLMKKKEDDNGVKWILRWEEDETEQSKNLRAFLEGIKAITDSALNGEGIFTVWEGKIDQIKSLNQKLLLCLSVQPLSTLAKIAAQPADRKQLEKAPSDVLEKLNTEAAIDVFNRRFITAFKAFLVNRDYALHSGGSKYKGKKYPDSIKQILKKMDTILSSEDALTNVRFDHLKKQILDKIKDKSETKGFFGAGARDKTTIEFYAKIIEILDEKNIAALSKFSTKVEKEEKEEKEEKVEKVEKEEKEEKKEHKK